MQCPKCKAMNSSVIDSRLTENNTAIRRRRECEECKNRFTTFERLRAADIIVVKKDQTREQYDRQKLEHGLWRACGKRPVTQVQVSDLLTALEDKWSTRKEIPSSEIGNDVLEALKNLDPVAYIRFASVYQSFTDVKSFQRAIRSLSAMRLKPASKSTTT